MKKLNFFFFLGQVGGGTRKDWLGLGLRSGRVIAKWNLGAGSPSSVASQGTEDKINPLMHNVQ